MKRAFLALAFLCLSLVVAGAAEVPIPPPPTRWATDTAGFMSPQALRAVDQLLENFERTSGNQVLVWIANTTGDTPLEDWTVKAFAQWKVGRKGLDNGLVLFLFATDRTARIEVGYGLEGQVPDAIASRVLNDVVLPKVKEGDRDGAVLAGVNSLTAAISGVAAGTGEDGTGAAGDATPRGSSKNLTLSFPQKVLAGLVVIGFLILLITNPSLALYLLFTILSGGRGGGGGGGGGGFSGGGGSSGGGGASGRW